MKTFTSPSQKIGRLGEEVAVKYLMSRSFVIIERNFTKKWGEIDIVAKKGGVLHFVEVKTVSNPKFRPEEQMHIGKQKRMIRMVETYLIGHDVGKWQCDLACIYMNMKTRRARVKMIERIILGE